MIKVIVIPLAHNVARGSLHRYVAQGPEGILALRKMQKGQVLATK
jgi:hypothetical protein